MKTPSITTIGNAGAWRLLLFAIARPAIATIKNAESQPNIPEAYPWDFFL